MTSVAERVVTALAGRGQTLATAESLTGGLLGAALTEVPGASRVYRGGFVTYATDTKASLAGVGEDTLAKLGPVAAETAAQMAAGAAARCAADWAVATTGVAGPDPQDGHPVGQVFVALVGPDTSAVVELALPGGRLEVRRAAANRALRLLADALGIRGDPAGFQP